MTDHLERVIVPLRDAASIALGEEIARLQKLVTAAAAEIHMAEVERDQARMFAKGIILNLVDEFFAPGRDAWLYSPRQFKLAILARLEHWR